MGGSGFLALLLPGAAHRGAAALSAQNLLVLSIFSRSRRRHINQSTFAHSLEAVPPPILHLESVLPLISPKIRPDLHLRPRSCQLKQQLRADDKAQEVPALPNTAPGSNHAAFVRDTLSCWKKTGSPFPSKNSHPSPVSLPPRKAFNFDLINFNFEF